MLLDDVRQAIDIAQPSLAPAKAEDSRDEDAITFYLESFGISKEEKQGVINLARESDSKVDGIWR
jgi:hypothetical protein